jgi:hypothetical protein
MWWDFFITLFSSWTNFWCWEEDCRGVKGSKALAVSNISMENALKLIKHAQLTNIFSKRFPVWSSRCLWGEETPQGNFKRQDKSLCDFWSGNSFVCHKQKETRKRKSLIGSIYCCRVFLCFQDILKFWNQWDWEEIRDLEEIERKWGQGRIVWRINWLSFTRHVCLTWKFLQTFHSIWPRSDKVWRLLRCLGTSKVWRTAGSWHHIVPS